MSAVWNDVKGRKIFKAATLYAAVAWGIIQIADILLPVLHYPEWIMSSMVLIAFSGFPIALIFGWLLDIRHQRAKAREFVDEQKGEFHEPSITSRIIEFSIIAVFGSGAALLYFNSANQAVRANIEPLQSVQSLIAPIKNQKTIAVLPFTSFGKSDEDSYFADGLSEELLNVLARNKNLRVAARTSSFQYKNQNINVKTIAQELGVQYLLEGSVRRSGDTIRVTAQLIKADEDVHIFSSTWDKDITNIFKVQDEIAQSVLETLEIKLLGKSDSKKLEPGTQDIAAFAEYSRGVAYLRNRSEEDFIKAIEHLQQALKLDPNYAEANAMLAETYLLQSSYGLIKQEQAFELGKPNIDRAFEINPQLAEGHAVSGLYHWQMASMKEAEENSDKEASKDELAQAKYHLTKAIELNPSNAEAYMWYGSILQMEGQIEDGSRLFEKAFEIDPQAAVVGYNRGSDLVRMGEYEEAMAVFNTIVRNNPNYPNAYAIAGSVSYSVGQLDQAYSLYKRISELGSSQSEWLMNANKILVPIGNYQQAQQNLDELLTLNGEKYKQMISQMQAELWLASNDRESLFQWVDTLKEDSEHWGHRLWRGFSAMLKRDWKYAIIELESSLALLKADNSEWRGEMSVRIQLFLARAYQASGDQIKADFYLEKVSTDINQVVGKRLIRPQRLRYSQASRAALANNSLEALSLLRQAVNEGFVEMWLVKVDPTFDSLRNDPTFAAIVREFEAKMRIMRLKIEAKENKLADNGSATLGSRIP